MTEPRGHSAGPWLAVGLIVAAPALYMTHVMARTWTPYHTAIVLAIGGAVLWRFAHVFGVGAEHALHNRRARDQARTSMIELQARAQPALADNGVGEWNRARAAVAWAEAEAARATPERREIPIRVNGSLWGSDDEEAIDG
ncbi:MAG: hypothetical protein ABI780_01810 [Ardenticatenales bacterium]